MDTGRPERVTAEGYVSLCRFLARAGSCIGISADVERARASKVHAGTAPTKTRKALGWTRDKRSYEALKRNLALSAIALEPEDILVAGKALYVVLAVGLLVALPLASCLINQAYLAPAIAVAIAVPLFARETLISFASKAAARRAEQVLRSSAEATNLMIMSLRHEPSISKAIAFGSNRTGEFSAELKGCTWGVIMGGFASFEDALLSLGDRWAEYSDELKASLNSMVTASRESTQEGKRRALDRANQSMISGAKRRIEVYALSLSTPSMLIFGLGILLPMMVGSFLPMLSWNIWSMDQMNQSPDASGGTQSGVEMVFIMNVLFPAIAILVAMSALSNHPLEAGVQTRAKGGQKYHGLVTAVLATCVLPIVAWFMLSGLSRSIGMLLAGVLPISFWLISYGWKGREQSERLHFGLEDALFKTGARMLEGENFESALHHAGSDLKGESAETIRRMCFSSTLQGEGSGSVDGIEDRSFGDRNALQGLRIARDAASKDELAAGILAMDIACYLRDLRDLERTLTNRLKPTISMMKTTAMALAPIVLGVTYSIYLSLGSLIGGGTGGGESGLFFLVLGLFLAQMNAVVVYFVWGIEGKCGIERLAMTVGSCLIISELVYIATAVLASL